MKRIRLFINLRFKARQRDKRLFLAVMTFASFIATFCVMFITFEFGFPL